MPRRLVDDVTKKIAKAIDKRLVADTGGDRSLSGAPQRMKVERKVTGESLVTGVVGPGPRAGMAMWSWLEKGTGEPAPTKAKRTWTKPLGPALDEARSAIADTFHETIRST